MPGPLLCPDNYWKNLHVRLRDPVIRSPLGDLGGSGLAVLTDWQAEGMCRGSQSHLFFAPPRFERKVERERREARAKAICEVCPVLSACREYALTLEEAYGVWGGLTANERRRPLLRLAPA